MARFYAQLCTGIFLIATIGGLLLGNAQTVVHGDTGGNLGSVALHLTWARDALDAVLLAVFAYVGFVASRRAGRLTTLVTGVVLVVIAILGFVVGDTDQAGRSVAGLHFTAVVNVFDAVIGVIAVLAALGTIEDDTPYEQQSIIRPGTTIGGGKSRA